VDKVIAMVRVAPLFDSRCRNLYTTVLRQIIPDFSNTIRKEPSARTDVGRTSWWRDLTSWTCWETDKLFDKCDSENLKRCRPVCSRNQRRWMDVSRFSFGSVNTISVDLDRLSIRLFWYDQFLTTRHLSCIDFTIGLYC